MKKADEKSEKNQVRSKKNSTLLAKRLKEATEGLVYISEIDAPFTVFESESNEPIAAKAENQSEVEVEQVEFAQFFERLTRRRDWHGEIESGRTRKFLDLQKLIEESLSDIRVYRIGRTQIRIIIVGRAENGHYLRIETDAVET